MEEKPEQTRNYVTKLIKIVLYGPESTGKTTLARQLAAHYDTVWVPEYMRNYLETKWKIEKKLVSKEDLLPIAKGQLALEKEASEKVDKLLICDTDLLELKVYSEYYYNGFCPDFIRKKVNQPIAPEAENSSFYLLTSIDIPWEADILRDRPNDREEMFRIFEAELIKQDFPYEILKGKEDERLMKAVEIIDQLLK